MRHPLDSALLYRAWQWPFVAQKVACFRRRAALEPSTRVLDIGCGPGTNAGLFAGTRHIGLDRDAGYVRSAAGRGMRVMVGDAAALPLAAGAGFDCVFVNSLLHHLTDAQVESMLARVVQVMHPDGRLHVIDLVVPPRGIGRRLALADRGEHPRTLSALRTLLARHVALEHEEPFRLTLAGVPLWAMIYFCGSPRHPA